MIKTNIYIYIYIYIYNWKSDKITECQEKKIEND